MFKLRETNGALLDVRFPLERELLESVIALLGAGLSECAFEKLKEEEQGGQRVAKVVREDLVDLSTARGKRVFRAKKRGIHRRDLQGRENLSCGPSNALEKAESPVAVASSQLLHV